MIKDTIKSEELKTMIRLKTSKYDYAEVTDEDIENLEELELRRFKADGQTRTDIDIAELKLFKGLKSLTLVGFEISPDLKKTIGEYKNLDTLQLISCEFSEVEDMLLPSTLDEFIIDRPENAYGISYPKARMLKFYNTKLDFDGLDIADTELLVVQNSEIDNYRPITSEKARRIDFDGTKVYGSDGMLIEEPKVPAGAIFTHEENTEKYLDDRM